MLPAPVIMSVLKYSFLGLVVTGAGFLVANTALLRRQKSEAIEDLTYKARISTRNDSSMLVKNSVRCLTQPSRPFCLMSHKRRLELLSNAHIAPPPSGNRQDKTTSPHPVYLLLEDFKDLMSSLNVKPILLEPSMLFCMLPPLQKYILISSGLETDVLKGSPSRVTFGVLESDGRILSQESSVLKFLESGYEVSRARKWLKIGVDDFGGNFYTTRYFYSRHNMTIHVIVFFQKHAFLWYPGLSEIDFPIYTGPFGKNCIYENFTGVQLRFENGRESGFYFPSDMEHFLLQIQHSEFEECRTREEKRNQSPHPSLTIDQLIHRVIIAIKELKSFFAVFWLWKDTLSGWKESCNIFQQTPEFNVAVQSNEISKINLNETSNEYLRLLQFHQWEEHKLILDCYGLRINIFMIYKDSRSIWYYEGHLIKIRYSNFRFCSTSVMGQLVHLPCGNELKILEEIL